MNLAKAFSGGGYPSPTLSMLQSWESQEGAHTPSGSKTPIAICGWLLKMKREPRKFRSTWNRRWFTVEDGAFHWYKTSSSDACGRLNLIDITSVRKFVSAGPNSFSFIVHSTNRDMLLKADTANDESRWVRGLTLQIDLVHGGTFQGPPSAKNRRRTVLRLMDGVAGASAGRGGKGVVGEHGGTRGQGDWEGNQFREINNRIRAIMDERDAESAGTMGVSSGSSSTTGIGDNDPGNAESQKGFSMEHFPIRRVKPTPRDPRGVSIRGRRVDSRQSSGTGELGRGGSEIGRRGRSFKVLPVSTPRSYSYKDRSDDEAHVGRAADLNCDERRSKPVMPSGSPPAHARSAGRRGTSSRGTSKSLSGAAIGTSLSPGAVRSEIVEIAGGSDCEEGFDGRWARSGGRGRDGGCGRTPKERKQHNTGGRRGDSSDEDVERSGREPRRGFDPSRKKGGGNSGGGAGKRTIQTQFQDLGECSSDSSVRTRDEHFMDDFFFNMDTTRSSLSPARASGRSANGSRKDDRKSIENGVGKSSVNRLPNQRYSTSIKGSDNATRGSNDKHSNNHASGSKTSSMVLSPRHRRRRAQSNFDDDESSREEDGHGHGTLTLDEASYWLRSAGLPSGNAGGSNKMHERRTTSGGSITAEDSWSGGMGRGGYYDDDTPSTSHFGSSGRSNSASRPSRRYLVEQNRLRQGW